jgi:hypothetical protein
MSTFELLFQLACTREVQCSTKSVGIEESGHHHHLIECNLFSPRYS